MERFILVRNFFSSNYIFREEHGGEFLKVTHSLAERLANAGREANAEEVEAPLNGCSRLP